MVQGRFKAILVGRQTYLLALRRCVELNPVRAGMTKSAQDWRWSSYFAHTCQTPTPEWLDSDGLRGVLLGAPVRSVTNRMNAASRYAALVVEGAGVALWETGLRQQFLLGDDAFVAAMQEKLHLHQQRIKEIPRAQRRRKSTRTVLALTRELGDRNLAVAAAYREGGMTVSASRLNSGSRLRG